MVGWFQHHKPNSIRFHYIGAVAQAEPDHIKLKITVWPDMDK